MLYHCSTPVQPVFANMNNLHPEPKMNFQDSRAVSSRLTVSEGLRKQCMEWYVY